jgi:hypothetical protein
MATHARAAAGFWLLLGSLVFGVFGRAISQVLGGFFRAFPRALPSSLDCFVVRGSRPFSKAAAQKAALLASAARVSSPSGTPVATVCTEFLPRRKARAARFRFSSSRLFALSTARVPGSLEAPLATPAARVAARVSSRPRRLKPLVYRPDQRPREAPTAYPHARARTGCALFFFGTEPGRRRRACS